jgi:phosphatidylglycerophosphate synthase
MLASRLRANDVTALAAALGVGAALFAALGRFALAGWLFMFSGILDTMDGRLARARGEVSPAGAALDSIIDRYTDALMLVGLGVWFRHSWVLVAVLMALVGTSAVPYVRAKAEALGFPVRDGLMQRTERILYLGASVALAPVVDALAPPAGTRPPHLLAAAGVVFLAVTSNATAISRFRRLLRAIGAAGGNPVGVPG